MSETKVTIRMTGAERFAKIELMKTKFYILSAHIILCGLVFLATAAMPAWAQSAAGRATATSTPIIQNDVYTEVADIKLNHRFGTGLMIAGASGIMGVMVDVNLNPFLSVMGHIGTGYEYISFGGRAAYYILGLAVHPFIGIGYANWSAGPGIRNLSKIYPTLIYSSLLNEEERAKAFTDGFMKHLVYPTFGFQYIHNSQFGASAEIMYLFDVSRFKGAPYFGVNAFYFF